MVCSAMRIKKKAWTSEDLSDNTYINGDDISNGVTNTITNDFDMIITKIKRECEQTSFGTPRIKLA